MLRTPLMSCGLISILSPETAMPRNECSRVVADCFGLFNIFHHDRSGLSRGLGDAGQSVPGPLRDSLAGPGRPANSISPNPKETGSNEWYYDNRDDSENNIRLSLDNDLQQQQQEQHHNQKVVEHLLELTAQRTMRLPRILPYVIKIIHGFRPSIFIFPTS
uniref:Uncharacterized protein n=1 Tax=Anopheles albimanus TaxID=7167 RepID=A0A182FNG6_ANOAL